MEMGWKSEEGLYGLLFFGFLCLGISRCKSFLIGSGQLFNEIISSSQGSLTFCEQTVHRKLQKY